MSGRGAVGDSGVRRNDGVGAGARRVKLSARQLDRAVGVVLASAAGDALGSQYEFGPGLHDDAVPEFGVGVFGHERGEWTDDTSMAMPILEAAARGESLLDPGTHARIVQRWIEWSATAKDVGAQTRAVLGLLGREGSRQARPAVSGRDSGVRRNDGSTSAAKVVHDRTGRSAGNGSLMRTGPVALGYLAEGAEADLAEAAGAIAQLTHYEQDNVDAVVLWCLAIRHAVLIGRFEPRAGLPWLRADRRERWGKLIDSATAPGVHPRQFRETNGWVVTALQGALAAVAGASDLREALYRAVRGGGDTDTVAAIAGSLAGARWGATQVPLSWRRLLHGWPGHDANDLTRLAVLAAKGGRPDRVGWPVADTVPSDGFLHTAPRRHPHDEGAWLGSQNALSKLPPSVGAVVSLCRVGAREVPSGLESVQVWLVDQPGQNNNLDVTLADATDVIAELRREGTEVFVHCAEARSRTAAVAALYGVRHCGVPLEQAWLDVARTLPHFAPAEFHREAVARLSKGETA